ncbi:MAG: sigma-54-dependent Fis family transcriptional regulator [candidate division NC10 bacterium]|nr:sigma-54-dependent Fis family transcriptional regulator [candidate division NC10 bacterium]
MTAAPPFRILVVDDEAPQRELLAGFLAKQGYEVVPAVSGAEALERLQRETFDLILTDHRMPQMSGLDLLKAARETNPEVPVVVMTAYGSVEQAVAAMQAGAYDYLGKPIDLDDLLHRIGKVRERQQLLTEVRALREDLRGRYRLEGIIGESGAMQEVLGVVRRVAPSTATVLIQGESGTGKELIARALHYQGPRASGPFVAVNCAALPETLLESELFGHEKGAFTGASERRVGRFEAAEGGTIFLDEIGDLTLALQVKLLRVLQERRIERLGANRPIPVDVRVLAATNQDLERAVRERRFREDLYYRLNVVTITIQPLRRRREDLPLFLDHFLKKFAEANGKAIQGFTREARDALMKYDYPGNVRELENIVERAVLLTRGEVIGLSDLPLAVQEGAGFAGAAAAPASLPALLEQVEREKILEALRDAGGVQTRAAERLGISERALRYKLKKYGLAEGGPGPQGLR